MSRHIKVNTQENIYSPNVYGGQITVWFDAKEDFETFYKVINHLVEVTITPDKGVME
jgi:hypothetical protein